MSTLTEKHEELIELKDDIIRIQREAIESKDRTIKLMEGSMDSLQNICNMLREREAKQ